MTINDSKWADWLKLREQLFDSSNKFLNSIQKLEPKLRDRTVEKSKWSPKDVLSHIVGWDVEVVKQFSAFIVNPDVDDEYDINAFNKKSALTRKDYSWHDIVSEFKNAQSELSKVVSKLTIENIDSEPRFTEWVEVLIGHYDHHRLKLEKLLG